MTRSIFCVATSIRCGSQYLQVPLKMPGWILVTFADRYLHSSTTYPRIFSDLPLLWESESS